MATNMEKKIVSGIRSVWADEELLDYTINVEDKSFKVHKLVMASGSDYFKAMLTGTMKESNADSVRLEGQSSIAVSSIINFVYNGEFGTTKVPMEDVLSCAVYLQIQPAIEKSAKKLCKEVNLKNCFDILNLFNSFALKEGVAHVQEFIKNNVEKTLKNQKVDGMGYDVFVCYMDAWRKSERGLFDVVAEWVEADFTARQQNVNHVFSRVRFTLMTPEELEAVKASDAYTKCEGAWRDLIKKALDYHKLPGHKQAMAHSEQSTVRGEPQPVIFAKDKLGPAICSLPEGQPWKLHTKESNMPKMKWQPAAVVTINNDFLVVCEPFSADQKWYMFNPLTWKWSNMAKLMLAREHFALVHHAKQLYALGGLQGYDPSEKWHTKTMEAYAIATDQWIPMYPVMAIRQAYHCACVSGDYMYITGGIDDNGCPSRRMDCFNFKTNGWEEKGPVRSNSRPIFMVPLEIRTEKLIFILGDDMELRTYNTANDHWSSIDYFQSEIVRSEVLWSDKGICLGHAKTLYFLNFLHDDHNYLYVRPEHEKGKCAKWTFSEDSKDLSKTIKQEVLKFFPKTREGTKYAFPKNMFGALLSIPPQMFE